MVEARVLVSISAKIPEQMYKELVKRAESEGVTVSVLVRRAIGNYLGMPVEQPLEAKLRELEELKAKIAKLSDLEARIAKLEELVSRTQSTPTPTLSSSGSSKSGAKEESKYVKTISIEWASRKGLNLEKYMKDKESQGYICNDTASHVICVWREELEQAVVDLNNAKTRMGELGKVLSGVRLEVAKAAEKAGLLWFDAREGRWKIH